MKLSLMMIAATFVAAGCVAAGNGGSDDSDFGAVGFASTAPDVRSPLPDPDSYFKSTLTPPLSILPAVSAAQVDCPPVEVEACQIEAKAAYERCYENVADFPGLLEDWRWLCYRRMFIRLDLCLTCDRIALVEEEMP